MTNKLIQFGVNPHLIVQSAFGIDLPKQKSSVSRRSSVRQPIKVGFIGTLAPHKGCHLLLRAFNRLIHGQAVLKVYGDMENLPNYAQDLIHLADNNVAIEFCGTFHNSKISEILAELDVLVVPSVWYENTPLVVYSAQASGCPVIASNYPGISEVIKDQINGLLFEAGNVEALLRQLNRVIDEPNLLSQLSVSAIYPKSTAMYVDELLSTWTIK